MRCVFERLGLDEHFDQVRGHRTAAGLAGTVLVMAANRADGAAVTTLDRTTRAPTSA